MFYIILILFSLSFILNLFFIFKDKILNWFFKNIFKYTSFDLKNDNALDRWFNDVQDK